MKKDNILILNVHSHILAFVQCAKVFGAQRDNLLPPAFTERLAGFLDIAGFGDNGDAVLDSVFWYVHFPAFPPSSAGVCCGVDTSRVWTRFR